jgi:hypothetical protein
MIGPTANSKGRKRARVCVCVCVCVCSEMCERLRLFGRTKNSYVIPYSSVF